MGRAAAKRQTRGHLLRARRLGEARWLGRADRLYHRIDVPDAILARARADADRIACAAAPDGVPPGLSVDIGWGAAR